MQIRRFKDTDAEEISKLIERDCIEVNTKDYPLEEMQKKAKEFLPDAIKKSAQCGNMYVVCDGDLIVGTGTITEYNNSKTESFIHTIYVLPEYHGKGVGRKIIETLEQDAMFLRAKRVEVYASITACGFYERCGFTYKNGKKQLNSEKRYPMEKFNTK